MAMTRVQVYEELTQIIQMVRDGSDVNQAVKKVENLQNLANAANLGIQLGLENEDFVRLRAEMGYYENSGPEDEPEYYESSEPSSY